LSKLDFVIAGALLAGCAFWIERGQRVVIDAPTPSELAVAPACPDNDNMPYSANCVLYMSGTKWRAISGETGATQAQPTPQVEGSPPATSSSCPSRDNVPYDESCIAYMQGATTLGMRWRARAPAMPAPVDATTPVVTATGISGKR
jgi:hypothetical protein